MQAKVERVTPPEPVTLATSRNLEKNYFRWARLRFDLAGTPFVLTAFKMRPDDPADTSLFVPFADRTSGAETYGSGRFMDVEQPAGATVELDFNRAYNPLCNYSPAYNCPLPPAENRLAVAVRAGDFMENMLNFVASIKSTGAFFLPVPAGVKLPMVATRDIAEVAARVLLDGSWSGRRAVTVYGPELLSHAEVAAILREVLGRPVGFTQVTPDQAREAMLGMGFTADLVAEFLEMYDAFSTGRIVQGLPAKPDFRGTTTFREFAATVIKPGF